LSMAMKPGTDDWWSEDDMADSPEADWLLLAP
jgi:hypothetical protein